MKEERKKTEYEKPHEEKDHKSAEINKLKDELESLKQERDALYQKMLRAVADLDNFKKISEQRQNEFVKFAGADIITKILPVFEALNLAIEAAGNDMSAEASKKFIDGLNLISKNFADLLNKEGLYRQETKGLKFDPKLHEAVSREETNEYPEGAIIQELRPGYILNEEVLRPAMVKIAVPLQTAKGSEEKENE